SRYEGLGRALTEAMAAARPVVATCVNGIPDLVEPGATGLLVPPGDPGAAAEQVCWLLTHPVAATAMGHQARERVLNAFDADQMVSAIDDTYRQLLGLPELTVPATIPEASLT
ncbi:MAG: glycosyltransferase family 4 protein, partial [Actinomycetota bacterium]